MFANVEDAPPLPADGDAVRAFTVLGVLAGAGAGVLSLLLVVMAAMGKDKVKVMPLVVMGASAAACEYYLEAHASCWVPLSGLLPYTPTILAATTWDTPSPSRLLVASLLLPGDC